MTDIVKTGIIGAGIAIGTAGMIFNGMRRMQPKKKRRKNERRFL